MNLSPWIWILLTYFLGMIPAIFIARQSAKILFKRRSTNDWQVWLLFPLSAMQSHSENRPLLKPGIITHDIFPANQEICLDKFCLYIVCTMLLWPLRITLNTSFLFVFFLMFSVQKTIRWLAPVVRPFAKL
jgi:hypothetical protein